MALDSSRLSLPYSSHAIAIICCARPSIERGAPPSLTGSRKSLISLPTYLPIRARHPDMEKGIGDIRAVYDGKVIFS